MEISGTFKLAAAPSFQLSAWTIFGIILLLPLSCFICVLLDIPAYFFVAFIHYVGIGLMLVIYARNQVRIVGTLECTFKSLAIMMDGQVQEEINCELIKELELSSDRLWRFWDKYSPVRTYCMKLMLRDGKTEIYYVAESVYAKNPQTEQSIADFFYEHRNTFKIRMKILGVYH